MEIGSFTVLRKPGQSIVIGDPNSDFFAVVTIKDRKAAVNVSAPKSVPILRGELLNAPESN